MLKPRLKLRPWHWLVIGFISGLPLVFLWIALAYEGLPRLWSRHEHKHIGRRDEIVAYTAQDIPGDPVNLHVIGQGAAIARAFTHAGWSIADPVSLRSGWRIGESVLLRRAYPQAPVSPLFVRDRMQDVAFEKADGRSPDRRHHARFWQIGADQWLGAATYDRGVGLSLFTLQITHHIGADVDAERDSVSRLLQACGARTGADESSRIAPGAWHRNGGGDRYRTDGRIAVLRIAAPAC